MTNLDGYRIETDNTKGDDFFNFRTTITLTRRDGQRLRWTLPDRLIKRLGVFAIALEEMAAELEERPPL